MSDDTEGLVSFDGSIRLSAGEYDRSLATARAEGFAAGEQAMRGKAAKHMDTIAKDLRATVSQESGVRATMLNAFAKTADVNAETIRALPLSAPVWGAEQEREAIVKWLRDRDNWDDEMAGYTGGCALMIERADHLPKESKDE